MAQDSPRGGDNARTVEADDGSVFRLRERLSSGRQGVVYLAEPAEGAVASRAPIVKIIHPLQGTDRQRWVEHCGVLQRLQLEELDIAGPLLTLKPPDLGYVA